MNTLHDFSIQNHAPTHKVIKHNFTVLFFVYLQSKYVKMFLLTLSCLSEHVSAYNHWTTIKQIVMKCDTMQFD